MLELTSHRFVEIIYIMNPNSSEQSVAKDPIPEHSFQKQIPKGDHNKFPLPKILLNVLVVVVALGLLCLAYYFIIQNIAPVASIEKAVVVIPTEVATPT